MPFSIWLAFTGASFLLAIAPGPDNLFVLTQSAVHGVRAGVIVVLGLCTVSYTHPTLPTTFVV